MRPQKAIRPPDEGGALSLGSAARADYVKLTTDGDPYLDFSALTRGQTTALS